MLSVFSKEEKHVVVLIGDNTSTNLVSFHHFGRLFVGSNGHRFNLAVKDFLSKRQFIVEKVQRHMKRISYLIPATLLRQFTTQTAKKNNIARWSSTYLMLLRYSQVREHVPRVDNADVMELLLCDDKTKKLKNWYAFWAPYIQLLWSRSPKGRLFWIHKTCLIV